MKNILILLLLLFSVQLFAQDEIIINGKRYRASRLAIYDESDSTWRPVLRDASGNLKISIPDTVNTRITGVTLNADTLLSKDAPYVTVVDTTITVTTTAAQLPNIVCDYFTLTNLTNGATLKCDQTSGITSSSDVETLLYLDKLGEKLANTNKYYAVANTSTKVLIKAYRY